MIGNKKLWDIKIRIEMCKRSIGNMERHHAVSKDYAERCRLEGAIWNVQGKLARNIEELELAERYAKQMGTL
jgi:hypothetical protein